MSMNDRRYIIHFKYNPNKNLLFNLSESNDFRYSYKNPTEYSVTDSITSTLTTESYNLTDLEFNEYGIKFNRNSTQFSPFINISSMTNYLEENEDFTIYYRLKSDADGLSNISIDLFNTHEPGVFDNTFPYSRFYFENGILKLELKDTNTFNAEVDCKDYIEDKQYHIAFTRSSGTIRIYIDGFKMYDSDEMGDEKYTGTLFYNTPNTTILPVYIGCVSSEVSVTLDDITICKGFCFFKEDEFIVPEDVLNILETIRELGMIEHIKFDTNVMAKITVNYHTLVSSAMVVEFDTSVMADINVEFATNVMANITVEFATMVCGGIVVEFDTNVMANITAEFATDVRSVFMKKDNIIRNITVVYDDNNPIKYDGKSDIVKSVETKDSIWRQLSYIRTLHYDTKLITAINFEYSHPVGDRDVVKTVIVKSSTRKDIKSLRRKMIAFVVNPLYSRKKGV